MKRDLTAEERDKITQIAAAGDRIEATSLYISITGCGLTEAQDFIRTLVDEAGVADSVKLAKKQQKGGRWFGLWQSPHD
jgi:ribosomal protein L7/L12